MFKKTAQVNVMFMGMDNYFILPICYFVRRDSNTLSVNHTVQQMLIECAIYYSVILNSYTGFGN